MYVYIHICMYMNMYICTCIFIYIYICLYIYIHVNIYIYVHIYVLNIRKTCTFEHMHGHRRPSSPSPQRPALLTMRSRTSPASFQSYPLPSWSQSQSQGWVFLERSGFSVESSLQRISSKILLWKRNDLSVVLYT